MISLNSVVLPPDLFWSDEFGWTPVASALEYGTTGSAFVDVSKKKSGRPITLSAESDTCWLTRADVLALKALADLPGKEMTLTLYERIFTVIFAPGEKPFDAEPVWQEMPVVDDDKWVVTALRLIEI
ncbi:hypothetical protein [Desulfotalea psychrophila]|uniref:Uncharacterized protein n=1 Tax=Desulfotalea psychrophila (strain LSv54 / DSM 12343) TaxID=177439 RepID=Q6AMV3_DESPS|nr:hypothetical protein [Desulfotalea psychrophila]CAG36321.1 conserved hypothetical protein [Desulfotalea psychrophila LSv54]